MATRVYLRLDGDEYYLSTEGPDDAVLRLDGDEYALYDGGEPDATLWLVDGEVALFEDDTPPPVFEPGSTDLVLLPHEGEGSDLQLLPHDWSPTEPGDLHYWTGTEWVAVTRRYWTGTEWVAVSRQVL